MKTIKIVLFICFFALLILLGYIGTFSRMMADDYCTAAKALEIGVFPSVSWWYISWSGRFTATLLDSIAGWIGPDFAPIQPALILSLWLIALFVAFRRFGQSILDAMLLSSAFIVVVLSIMPNMTQSLYWGQGMHSVIPPLVLFAALFAIKCPWLAFLAAFIMGGFSETFDAAALPLLFLLRISWKEKRSFLAAALMGLLVSFTIVALAPGNTVREARLNASPGIIGASSTALESLANFFLIGVVKHGWVYLAIPTLALLLGWKPSEKITKWLILWLPFVILVLLFSCFFPIALLGNIDLPPRADIIPQSILVAGLFLWFCAIWAKVKPGKAALFASAAILVCLFIFIVPIVLQPFPSIRAYSERWDSSTAHLPGNNPIIDESWDGIQQCFQSYRAVSH